MTETTSAASAPPTPRETRRHAAFAWWSALQPMRGGKPNPLGDRASLARLRRASELGDILAEPAMIALYRRLGYGAAQADEMLPRVAVLACLLAHVRETGPQPARAVGMRRADGAKEAGAVLSPLRMRRLLQAREPDDLMRQMRRLIQLAGGKLDVGALAMLVLDWLDDERGDGARTRFAYDYFSDAPLADARMADAPRDDDEFQETGVAS